MPAETEVLSEEQMGARYGKDPETIRTWRKKRTGPAWFKAGGSVYYRMPDVLAWEAGRVVNPADAA